MEENIGLLACQFGFRRGKSMIDAIEYYVMSIVDQAGNGPLRNRKLFTMVSLDVANEFNTLFWEKK